MAKVAGSIWVDGVTLRYVDSGGYEWSFTGTLGAYGASYLPGSIWIEGANIKYIDGSRYIRTVPSVSLGGQTAIAGSIWVDNQYGGNNQLQFINSNTRYKSYQDVAYQNVHNNTPYYDDVDWGVGIEHPDLSPIHYTNTSGSRTHCDYTRTHSDNNCSNKEYHDHDNINNPYVDTPYTDTGYSDNYAHIDDSLHQDYYDHGDHVNYEDHGHGDHGDYTDHADDHTDTPGYNDAYDDVNVHSDHNHTNVAPHNNQITNIPHTNYPTGVGY